MGEESYLIGQCTNSKFLCGCFLRNAPIIHISKRRSSQLKSVIMLHQLDNDFFVIDDDENECINDEDLEELRELAEGDDQLLSLLEQERKFREKHVSAKKKDGYELQLMEQVENARSRLQECRDQYDAWMVPELDLSSFHTLETGSTLGAYSPPPFGLLFGVIGCVEWLWSTFINTVIKGVAISFLYDLREEFEEEIRKEREEKIREMREDIKRKRERMKLKEKN